MVVTGALMLAFAPWYLGISQTGPLDENGTPVWYTEDAQSEYDQLANSLLEGRLSLDVEPPEWLDQMENPYDPAARSVLEQETGESYLWDTAYYDGTYYVYFGIVPCLTFFVPFHALTDGAALPTGIPVLICLWLYLGGLAALIGQATTTLFPQARARTAVCAYIGAATASSLPFAAMVPSLYQIPVTMALALAVWGLFFWLKAYNNNRTSFILAGSTLVALILGCRPPLAVVAVFGVFLLTRTASVQRRRPSAGTLCSLVIPFLIVGAGIAWYNYSRFGSPFDFGAGYNLTVVDMANHGFSADRLFVGFWSYLLQPPSFTSSFPFLQAANLDLAQATGNYVEPMGGGLVGCFPFLWLIALTGLMRKRRKAACAILLMAGCGIVLVALDAQIGGMVGRYQLDFSFLFALAAACAIIGSVHEMRAQGRQRASRVLFGILVVTMGLALLYEATLIMFLTTAASTPSGVDYAAVNPAWKMLLE